MNTIKFTTNGKIIIEPVSEISVQVTCDGNCTFEPDDVEFCDGDCENCELPCGDVFPIPREAVEDAGLLGKKLLVQSEPGRLTIFENGEE